MAIAKQATKGRPKERTNALSVTQKKRERATQGKQAKVSLAGNRTSRKENGNKREKKLELENSPKLG